MSRRINEVQKIRLPILRRIRQRNGLGLDRNAAFALNGIGVEDLRFHLTRLQSTANLNDAVRQGGFTVVDVGDDGKISNLLHAITRHFGAEGRLMWETDNYRIIARFTLLQRRFADPQTPESHAYSRVMAT